ncbi:MAG: hypothetical protein CM15mP59_2770 [Flavobacteriaceae bacterium]|nr:MAG: hypothetical protein CM15mP59_2770 [Flavobacteriaceae bacterium]
MHTPTFQTLLLPFLMAKHLTINSKVGFSTVEDHPQTFGVVTIYKPQKVLMRKYLFIVFLLSLF